MEVTHAGTPDIDSSVRCQWPSCRGAQRHGADDITAGERLNLIVWNHSTLYRQTDHYKWRDVPEETEPPSMECLSFTHDRDYGLYKPYPPGKVRRCGLAQGRPRVDPRLTAG